MGRGCTIHCESEQQYFEALLGDGHLLVGADGINSLVRDHWKDRFGPGLDWRRNRFVWLGTTLPLDTFTFIFQANEHGLFQVHAYRFEEDRKSTRLNSSH